MIPNRLWLAYQFTGYMNQVLLEGGISQVVSNWLIIYNPLLSQCFTFCFSPVSIQLANPISHLGIFIIIYPYPIYNITYPIYTSCWSSSRISTRGKGKGKAPPPPAKGHAESPVCREAGTTKAALRQVGPGPTFCGFLGHGGLPQIQIIMNHPKSRKKPWVTTIEIIEY